MRIREFAARAFVWRRPMTRHEGPPTATRGLRGLEPSMDVSDADVLKSSGGVGGQPGKGLNSGGSSQKVPAPPPRVYHQTHQSVTGNPNPWLSHAQEKTSGPVVWGGTPHQRSASVSAGQMGLAQHMTTSVVPTGTDDPRNEFAEGVPELPDGPEEYQRPTLEHRIREAVSPTSTVVERGRAASFRSGDAIRGGTQRFAPSRSFGGRVEAVVGGGHQGAAREPGTWQGYAAGYRVH
eukprot:TRINITY_DN57583_c0_g1_i1.p1 TRINITY_DN57583_c0_g1~~TRINITY_DN57583_c0_g1_i1.p1  ORF type:complete len:236 (+),score=18.43 TRINITY_DN57583_c0_g1_i1:71-778(+)